MGDWNRIDELERELVADRTPQFASEPSGLAGFARRVRSYLPGSHEPEPWGEPSAQVFYHEIHICGFM